ncbi:hypothetical protein I79_023631 [Cricetulus griseus]|uniref:Uncharacterized protein n=1 Tax=Cricetulus griseus TaxID=10029 RepID=G3IIG2_CRIGR|nr:hypothetical protein I79_023631 [Cricetulus griseus]
MQRICDKCGRTDKCRGYVNARINPGSSICFGNLKLTLSAAKLTHHSSHRAL